MIVAGTSPFLYINPGKDEPGKPLQRLGRGGWKYLMNKASSRIFIGLLASFMLYPLIVHGDTPLRDALFHIERNKNANIVQYDARLTKSGLLDRKEPVVAYWIRHAEQGQMKKLSWLQRKFAYGFKVKLDSEQNTAILDMAVDLGRTILVRRDGQDYRAITDINGETSYVDKVFIHARGKGLTTRVNYIEWYGHSVDSGEELYERFSP